MPSAAASPARRWPRLHCSLPQPRPGAGARHRGSSAGRSTLVGLIGRPVSARAQTFVRPPPSPNQAWPHQQRTCCRLGKGDKNAADQAAVDMMRKVLNDISMDGVVVIGEGEKDEAPMLYCGASAFLGDKCGWVLTASDSTARPVLPGTVTRFSDSTCCSCAHRGAHWRRHTTCCGHCCGPT